MKQRIKRALQKTGALDILSHITSTGHVDIMLYHGFCPGSSRDERFPRLMPIDEFERQIKLFVYQGTPLRLEDLANEPSDGVVVTFDDGYASNYELAFPILKKYDFPATVFVTTGFVDRRVPLWGDWLEFLIMARQPDAPPAEVAQTVYELKRQLHNRPIGEIHAFLYSLSAHLQTYYDWNRIPDVLCPLNWDQIREMRNSRLVSFGAHTVSHPILSRCPDAMQWEEIVNSKLRLEQELDEPCTLFAYPYGKRSDYTDRTKQFVEDAGYLFALSAETGFNQPLVADHFELKRWGADIATDDLGYIVSGGPAISRYMWRHAAN
jgi:peptidoglycan/xylan/chitin deacetylase (PgdA/CDA1 family)